METEGIKWPADFTELQSMDSAFKCGICYDYMKTSMITLCSHTYCSLCIRKFLQYSTKCPICFIETHENDLRNNRPLDNIIMLYLGVQNKLLRALRVAEVATRSSAIASPATNFSSQSTVLSSVTPKSGFKAVSTSSLRTPSERTPSAKSRLFPPESPSLSREGSNDDIPESLECKVPLMFTSTKPTSSLSSKNKAPVEKATCPVCQVEIPSRNINIHLDACLDRSKSSPKEKTVINDKKRDPLPKRLYHMMNDRVLKQELKSHGLSVQGDRKTWLNRIRRFTVLYNSETDVDKPRPVSSLIQQLEREEREEKKKENPLFKSLSQKVDRYSNPDAISKANKQYIEDNKDSFKKLIEEMKSREGRNIKPTKPINLLESDEETDQLTLVGGTEWDPEAPSTSSAIPPDNEELSKDSTALYAEQDAIHCDDTVLNGNIAEEDLSFQMSASPNQPRLLSESSLDSVFDFTPSRTTLTSSARKKSVKRTVTRKSRSPSPDPFNETSSVISENCIPDANLYQSIFGHDESNDQEISRSGNSVADDVECSQNGKSPISSNVRYSPIKNGEEPPNLTSNQLRPKRKQPLKPPSDENESLATRRPRRNTKKQKSSS